MTFNNVNMFKSVLNTLNTSGINSTSDKIKNGGAFSPTTFEAVSIMRAEFDNQWDSSYITKYEALLQTRLNKLKQELNNAYKALLETSGGMHIRENSDATSTNKALQTAYDTNLAGGSGEAFNNMPYYDDNTSFNDADIFGGTAGDGIPSYWEGPNGSQYEMRRLYVNGPALQIMNDVNITMRTEEVAGKAVNTGTLGNLLGSPPFKGGEKVAEYSTTVKTGGFWTTVNYLYNFSPRELKYDYVTAYSTTTEEAGTRQINGKQALLANRQVLDGRDFGDLNMNAATPVYSADPSSQPPVGSRIKWEPGSGSYITELNPFWGGDDRTIARRTVSNDSDFRDYLSKNDSFADNVKSTFPLANTGDPIGKKVEYGTEEMINGSMNSRLKWEYEHDGKGAADLNQDGDIDGNDIHRVKAAFVNHYIVQTKTVEMNSGEKSYGTIKNTDSLLIRSKGVDGSADHILIDNGNKTIDNNPDEKILMAGSSKISKTFTGDYIGGLHKIDSFNGQSISNNNGNIMFNKPVIIGEYEGFERAKMMSKGAASDYFDEINSLSKSKDKGEELAAKLQSEINASGMVDTDWHYSQYKDNDGDPTNGVFDNKIMFKIMKDVVNDTGVSTINYDPAKVTGGTIVNGAMVNPTGYKDPTVAFRKTFNLSADEISTLKYTGTMDGTTATDMPIDTPVYEFKDARIKITTSALDNTLDLIVNGVVVPAESPGIYNLKGFLKEGENVIATQMKFTGTGDHFFTLENYDTGVPTTTNKPEVKSWIEEKLSTDRTKNGDKELAKFNNNPNYGYTSSWQSKLMVQKAKLEDTLPTTDPKYEEEHRKIEQNIMELGSDRTATKVKDSNPLLRVLMDAMNNPEYKDIFYLGLLNSNIGKNLQIKATISAPTGGSVEGILDIQYNPKDHKFTLVQSKYDAFGGV